MRINDLFSTAEIALAFVPSLTQIVVLCSFPFWDCAVNSQNVPDSQIEFTTLCLRVPVDNCFTTYLLAKANRAVPKYRHNVN